MRRVALVTGAGRGLGAEISRQLTRLGIHVVLASRQEADARRVAERLAIVGLPASWTELDVTRPETIDKTVAAVMDTYRRIDILVNNAGITDGSQQASTADPGVVNSVWETNVLGAWRCASAVIPHMRTAGYGRIVNLSSQLGSLALMDCAQEPAYRVSKAGLNALTRVLAAELTGTGVLINAASPGWVRTDMGGPHAPDEPQDGADTPVWLATLPDDGPTGGFFHQREEAPW